MAMKYTAILMIFKNCVSGDSIQKITKWADSKQKELKWLKSLVKHNKKMRSQDKNF